MKEYLILRKNVQSGPFNLNDLVSMQLQPTDLIWVEGVSFNWRYPEEIEELASYVNNKPRETMVVTMPTPTSVPILEMESAARSKAVIAIKPDNNISIKTVKSTPHLVKVAVRENGAEEITNESYLDKMPVVAETLSTQGIPASGGMTDNRIEFFVLAVGAISLLAVLYLLFTTSYTI